MPQHIKDFKKALEEGREFDYLKNNGYQFSKEELIQIASECFYTAWQSETDGGCTPDASENWERFNRKFIENMNEYEDEFFGE